MNLTAINAAMDAAFAAALANPVRVPAQTVAAEQTVRTDVYSGPTGNGFRVVGMVKVGSYTAVRTMIYGPEFAQSRDWPADIEGNAKAHAARVYDGKLKKGATIGEVTYGITQNDQLAWTSALTALDNAAALGLDLTTTPVESVLGPILDINGNPVPSMTVTQFRQVMMQLAQRIGHLRSAE